MNGEAYYHDAVSGRTIWPLRKTSAALIVVDMQNAFVREGSVHKVPRIGDRIPNMRRLVETCRKLGVPVIYTREVYPVDRSIRPLSLEMWSSTDIDALREGSRDADICSELQPREGDIVIEKIGYSAFYNTRLDSILRNIRGRNAIDTLIICGTVTNLCCESTARDAFERDYKVVFGSDTTCARTDEFQRVSLKNIEYAFGRVMSCDEIVAALGS